VIYIAPKSQKRIRAHFYI